MEMPRRVMPNRGRRVLVKRKERRRMETQRMEKPRRVRPRGMSIARAWLWGQLILRPLQRWRKMRSEKKIMFDRGK